MLYSDDFDPSNTFCGSRWLRAYPSDYTPAWLSDFLLMEKGLTVLLGAPKARKSTLRRYLLGCCLSGTPAFGSFQTKRIERALVLVGESAPEFEAVALHRTLSSMKVDSYDSRVWVEKPYGFNLSSDDDLQALLRFQKQNRFELIFLDPLVNFHNADENDSKALGTVCRHLLALAEVCSVCVVHHTAKPSETDSAKTVGQRARGSSVLAGAADVSLLLGRRGQSESNVLFFETRHAFEPEPLQLWHDPDSGLWMPYKDAPLLKERARKLLETDPSLSGNKIAELLKARRGEVLKVVKELREEGGTGTLSIGTSTEPLPNPPSFSLGLKAEREGG